MSHDDSNILLPGSGELARIARARLERDGDVVRFTYTDPFGQPCEGFVVAWKGGFHAYRDQCPHWAVPLGGGGAGERADFVDRRTGHLVCQTHGARFDTSSGICISGPCEGEALEMLQVSLSDDGAELVVTRRRKLF